MHLCEETIAALVNRLDAVIRMQVCAQRGDAAGNGVCRNVNVAPKGLLERERSDDLPGVGQQYLQRGQFFGGQMQKRFSAIKGAVGLKPQAGKEESWL